MALVSIYVLKCPDTGDIRYVGKTNNPQKRLSSHICAPSKGCRAWVDGLSAMDKKPVMEVMEEVDGWEERERYWIRLFRSMGCDLLNIDEGGIVRVYEYRPYLPAGSKFRKAIQSIAQKYRLVSKEARSGLVAAVNGLKDVRRGIFLEMGKDAVEVFDEYVYEEIIEGRKTPLQIFG